MGGGGFMEHAKATNRSHRSQKQQRRKKFKNDQSDKVGTREDQSLNFVDSESENALNYRKQLDERIQRRRKIQNIALVVFLLVITVLFIYVLFRTKMI